MTRDEYDAFCAALPGAHSVVQWGGAQVWKVAGKVLAMARFEPDAPASFTFKVSDLAFEVLPDMPGLRPAPYMASRGLKWIQHYEPPGLPDDELREQIAASHALVARGLTKKVRAELGL